MHKKDICSVSHGFRKKMAFKSFGNQTPLKIEYEMKLLDICAIVHRIQSFIIVIFQNHMLNVSKIHLLFHVV